MIEIKYNLVYIPVNVNHVLRTSSGISEITDVLNLQIYSTEKIVDFCLSQFMKHTF